MKIGIFPRLKDADETAQRNKNRGWSKLTTIGVVCKTISGLDILQTTKNHLAQVEVQRQKV